ncbi:uncharacterized protein B0H18DRAFT_930880, partial [Fomitopsis serialis]|uniref:uncharacterized protein n=1 Tax=Fomitopsis serialis TaxID=139415 RepID=UPI0020084F88
MSFPGEQDEGWAGTWHGISMVFEIKRTRGEDPIDEYGVRYGKQATDALTQLAKSARNLLSTHGMLFVYVVGIYGDTARIYRFDHAACVVSRSFDFKETPWPLHELLWRFCYYQGPRGGARVAGAPPTNMLIGADPSFQRATDDDLRLAEEKCTEMGTESLTLTDKQACRWITVTRHSEDGTEVGTTRYLAYRIRSLNARLFSRATAVWDALEEGTWERCVIKDSWRQLEHDREDVLYDRIRGSPDRPPVYGHRTICGQLRDPKNANYYERSHMRVIMKTVGRPLSSFKSTKELVHALRDAIIGHRQAYHAGIIHRDISEGNVMICDTRISSFAGFLLDFDYGFDWKTALKQVGWPADEASWRMFVEKYNESLPCIRRHAPPKQTIPVLGSHSADTSKLETKMKQRTGTLDSMAIEILETYCAHDIRHDLESFLWLYFFGTQEGWDSAARKRQFLQTWTAFE